jgi:hypothetical protein
MQRRPLKTLAAQSTAQQLNSSTAQQGKLFDLKKITPM